jgi:hypothetical protein
MMTKLDTSMRSIMSAFAGSRNIPTAYVSFTIDGIVVEPQDTARSLQVFWSLCV